MKCPRCLNEDSSYFYLGSKGYYCRKCINFKRVLIDEIQDIPKYNLQDYIGDYKLNFDLTPKQQEISLKLLNLLKENKDVVLNCVCGAGKTEIVLESISYYLKNKLKVGYAISRKEVVLELSKRFNDYFKKAKVVKVCEGYTKDVYGDLIVCTTHQLYRYYKYFDLLIIDEVDAFPYKGNEVLNNIALNSIKGNVVYSTATLDKSLKHKIKTKQVFELKLLSRPHNKPMVVPKILLLPTMIDYIVLWWFIIYKSKKCLVFVRSINKAKYLYLIFKYLFPCNYITSKTKNKESIIDDFKNNKYYALFSTTILERGITIKGIDVVVLDADSFVFDEASLTQMVGRVGRSVDKTDGYAHLYAKRLTYEMLETIRKIKTANLSLEEVTE